MDRSVANGPDLYLIVSARRYWILWKQRANRIFHFQADQDAVYEQDILRDPHSIKPWIAYIEHKQQQGTLYEQAFVSYSSSDAESIY